MSRPASKPLAELAHDECRWPIAEDEWRSHLFCGERIIQRSKGPGFSYCARHGKIAVLSWSAKAKAAYVARQSMFADLDRIAEKADRRLSAQAEK